MWVHCLTCLHIFIKLVFFPVCHMRTVVGWKVFWNYEMYLCKVVSQEPIKRFWGLSAVPRKYRNIANNSVRLTKISWIYDQQRENTFFYKITDDYVKYVSSLLVLLDNWLTVRKFLGLNIFNILQPEQEIVHIFKTNGFASSKMTGSG